MIVETERREGRKRRKRKKQEVQEEENTWRRGRAGKMMPLLRLGIQWPAKQAESLAILGYQII